GAQGPRREQLHAGRRQLNGQWQPLQTGTQLSDDTGIGIRQLEIGLDCLSLLEEERDRRLVRQGCEIEQVVKVGYSQWWHRELVLGSHMQHFPACHQDLERWAGSEQGCYLLCRAHHLLEIVQQQQHLPLAQFLRETFQERPATSFLD